MTTTKYEIELPELPEEIRDTHVVTTAKAGTCYSSEARILWKDKWHKLGTSPQMYLGQFIAIPKSKSWTLADEIGRPMPFAVRTREGRKAYVVGYTRPMLEEYPWCIRYPEDIDGDDMWCVDVYGQLLSPSLEDRQDVVGLWEEE